MFILKKHAGTGVPSLIASGLPAPLAELLRKCNNTNNTVDNNNNTTNNSHDMMFIIKLV